MSEPLLPFREFGLLLSVAAWVIVSVVVYLSRRVNGDAPLTVRVGLLALWLYATLRLYSASSFVWGSAAADAGVFTLLRASVFVVMTAILIIVIALGAFYWRRFRAYRRKR